MTRRARLKVTPALHGRRLLDDPQLDHQVANRAAGRRARLVVLHVHHLADQAQRLGIQHEPDPVAQQHRIAARGELLAQGRVAVGVVGHQHLGDGADVALVEQPDLQRGGAVGIAVHRLRDRHAALAEIGAVGTFDVETLVEGLVTLVELSPEALARRLSGRSSGSGCTRRDRQPAQRLEQAVSSPSS